MVHLKRIYSYIKIDFHTRQSVVYRNYLSLFILYREMRICIYEVKKLKHESKHDQNIIQR